MGENAQACLGRLQGLIFGNFLRVDDWGLVTDVNTCAGDESIVFTLTEEGKRSGDAIIKVATEEDVEKKYIGKRYVEIEKSTLEEYKAVRETEALGENDRVVRLRGLSYGASEADIQNFFTGLDIVPGGVFIVVNSDGKCIGDGFAEFANSTDIPEALKKHRQKIANSSKLEMIRAQTVRPIPLMSINVKRRRNQRESPHHGYRASYEEHFYSPPYNAPFEGGRFMAEPYSTIEKYIHMRGLPFECCESDIETFFAPVPIISIGLCYNHDGRFNGEADVYFESNSDALRAMNKDKSRIGRRYAELFLRTRRMTHLRPPPPSEFYPPEPFQEPLQKIHRDSHRNPAHRSYISAYTPYPGNPGHRYIHEDEPMEDHPQHYSMPYPPKHIPSNYYSSTNPELIHSPLEYQNEGPMPLTSHDDPLMMMTNQPYSDPVAKNHPQKQECPTYPYY